MLLQLQDLTRKGPFSCTPARFCKIDPARSRRIFQESCRNFVQDSHAGVQEKRTFLVRSCKSVFTGNAITVLPVHLTGFPWEKFVQGTCEVKNLIAIIMYIFTLPYIMICVTAVLRRITNHHISTPCWQASFYFLWYTYIVHSYKL